MLKGEKVWLSAKNLKTFPDQAKSLDQKKTGTIHNSGERRETKFLYRLQLPPLMESNPPGFLLMKVLLSPYQSTQTLHHKKYLATPWTCRPRKGHPEYEVERKYWHRENEEEEFNTSSNGMGTAMKRNTWETLDGM